MERRPHVGDSTYGSGRLLCAVTPRSYAAPRPLATQVWQPRRNGLGDRAPRSREATALAHPGCDFILRRAFRGTRGIPGIEEVPNDLFLPPIAWVRSLS